MLIAWCMGVTQPEVMDQELRNGRSRSETTDVVNGHNRHVQVSDWLGGWRQSSDPTCALPDAAVDLSLTGLLSRGLTPLSFDYLYLGLTNASAFSPADMMPMVPCVKTAMRVQPLISIAVIGPVLTVPGARWRFT